MKKIDSWHSCQICYFHQRATMGCQKWAVPDDKGYCPYFEISEDEANKRTCIDSDLIIERGSIVSWNDEEFRITNIAPDKLHAYGCGKTRNKTLKVCECKFIS